MKKGRIVLAVAMAIYVASFFVSAVGRVYGGRVSPDIVGYECASMTLLSPMDGRRIEVVSREPFALYRLGVQRLDQSGFSGSHRFSAEEKDHQRNHDAAYGALADDAGMLDRFLSRTRDAWTRVLSLDWRHGGSDILNVVGARESSAGRAGFLRLMSKTRNHGSGARTVA